MPSNLIKLAHWYLEGIKDSLEYADKLTLNEIKTELVNNGYLKEKED